MSDWPNYLFRRDFTEWQDVLKDIPLGVIDEHSIYPLVAALQAGDTGVGKELWNVEEMKEWSVRGVEVIYNGLNSRDFATRSKFKYCLGIVFPQEAIGPTGRVYLCWNDPVVAEPIPDASE